MSEKCVGVLAIRSENVRDKELEFRFFSVIFTVRIVRCLGLEDIYVWTGDGFEMTLFYGGYKCCERFMDQFFWLLDEGVENRLKLLMGNSFLVIWIFNGFFGHAFTNFWKLSGTRKICSGAIMGRDSGQQLNKAKDCPKESKLSKKIDFFKFLRLSGFGASP